jgi:hypothetical protein
MKKTIIALIAAAITATAFAQTLTTVVFPMIWDPNPATDEIAEYQVFGRKGTNSWQFLGRSTSNSVTVTYPLGAYEIFSVSAISKVGLESQKSAPLTNIVVVPSIPKGLRRNGTITIK